MPTDSENVSVFESRQEDVLYRYEGEGCRVGNLPNLDDVMFGEGKCNASGNRLISFFNEVEFVIAVSSLWTRARPSLKQKSIIDHIVTDTNLL